jgi:hypothetical protein
MFSFIVVKMHTVLYELESRTLILITTLSLSVISIKKKICNSARQQYSSLLLCEELKRAACVQVNFTY